MKHFNKKAYKLLYSLGTFNLNLLSRVKNYTEFKSGKIPKFEYQLRRDYLKSSHRFSAGEFYQSYPPLNIVGMRPTLSRYKVYELDKYVTPKTSILDIGGNVGFFSLYVSRFVKNATILEIDSDFSKIGQRLAKKEKISNVKFINIPFEKLQATQKYDLIFSLAVHQYMKYSLDEYLKRLSELLNKKGKLLFETHEREWENLKGKELRWAQRKRLLSTIENCSYFTILKEDFIDDNQGRVRKFYILEKK